MSLQSDNAAGAKVYPPTAPLRLWCCELAAGKCAIRPEASASSTEVHILPLQTEQLARMHPSVYGQFLEGLEAISFSGLQQMASLVAI